MRTTLLLLAIFATPAFAAQTVWKWVDDNGVTHYSDRAVPGATRMELNVAPVGTEPVTTTTRPSASQSDAEESGAPYRNFEIWKPAQGETVPNTGGVVEVNIRVDPSLQPGHAMYLYLDGRLVEATGSTEYTLTEVPRGVHTVSAVITNSRGTRVQQTAPVSFTVHQASVANPPVGPALRPPPKPRPTGRGASNKLPRSQPSYAALNGEHARINPLTNQPVKPVTPAPAPGPKKP
jgi:hypothetical protein